MNQSEQLNQAFSMMSQDGRDTLLVMAKTVAILCPHTHQCATSTTGEDETQPIE
jgi:hypothetical protein